MTVLYTAYCLQRFHKIKPQPEQCLPHNIKTVFSAVPLLKKGRYQSVWLKKGCRGCSRGLNHLLHAERQEVANREFPKYHRFYSSMQRPTYRWGIVLRNDNPIPKHLCSIWVKQWENVGTVAWFAQWRRDTSGVIKPSPLLQQASLPAIIKSSQARRPHSRVPAHRWVQWCFLPFTHE